MIRRSTMRRQHVQPLLATTCSAICLVVAVSIGSGIMGDVMLVQAAAAAAEQPPHVSTSAQHQRLPSETTILLLDVDNTLYRERVHGIEAQIVANIHEFVGHELVAAAEAQLTLAQTVGSPSLIADDWHKRYGSTVEGLRRELWEPQQQLEASNRDFLHQKLRSFYDAVYARGKMNYRSLLMPRAQQKLMSKPSASSATTTASAGTAATPTGYSHTASICNVAKEQGITRRLLKSLAQSKSSKSTHQQESSLELHIASNSPSHHVETVLQATGLASIPWTRIWTPDRRSDGCTASAESPATPEPHPWLFPTKQAPSAFFQASNFWPAAATTDESATATDAFPPTGRSGRSNETYRVILVDDSPTVLNAMTTDWGKAAAMKMALSPLQDFQPICVHANGESQSQTLPQALHVAMGWIPTASSDNYSFSDVDYLQAKNMVDLQSINRNVWMQTIDEVAWQLQQEQHQRADASSLAVNDATVAATESSQTPVIVDVGAGLLSMLQLVLFGSHSTTNEAEASQAELSPRLPSLLGTLHKGNVWDSTKTTTVDYYAYEPNRKLEAGCIERLRQWGFQADDVDVSSSSEACSHELVFVRHPSPDHPYKVRVYLRFWDYRESSPLSTATNPCPHLIVGCCFADLLDPIDLASSLLRCFLSNESGLSNHAVVYFPITFAGVTQFLPPQPFQSSHGNGIPSDTKAFALYSKALAESCEHTLDPHQIESAMADYGAVCTGRGSSDWTIDPAIHAYLWRTMLYFFGTVAAPELQAHGWDARAWLERAKTTRPTLHVSNVDLLFRMPRLGKWKLLDHPSEQYSTSGPSVPDSDGDVTSYEEIWFTAPRTVGSNQKPRIASLQPNQVRVKTECSLISSGTELKVFQGRFDDAALDVNIQDMAGERMAYPLAYGYSLVGRVVECGSAVEDAGVILGKRVFTFSAHASEVVTDRSAVQLVPDGVAATDAIFMPSVETALSLVQDARPVLGENVAVFGQGLIGLLVTSLLQRHTMDASVQFGTVTTFDTIPDRLAWSAALGASQALFPAALATSPMEFDVAIEVSGNGRALQSAIDATRYGGRIVVGSWYGSDSVNLKLGLDFHRSHKVIRASQVSEIPTELMKTWTKSRRFQLTWELVKSLRPSRLVTRTTPLSRAQEAYEALESGDEIAVVFEY